ncbi:hypothetical protein ACJMK2_034497 [Sinanodonta woodiana]|uniref:C2H2-type domain-containing protein n=1 Tax=Sinanodonta woodiana TaxID=1069815 RepID=A0ABD3WTX9_SINWO
MVKMEKLQGLCDELCSTGQESLIVTFHTTTHQYKCVGSHLGMAFLQQREDVILQFTSFCQEHYRSRPNVVSKSPGPCIEEMHQRDYSMQTTKHLADNSQDGKRDVRQSFTLEREVQHQCHQEAPISHVSQNQAHTDMTPDRLQQSKGHMEGIQHHLLERDLAGICHKVPEKCTCGNHQHGYYIDKAVAQHCRHDGNITGDIAGDDQYRSEKDLIHLDGMVQGQVVYKEQNLHSGSSLLCHEYQISHSGAMLDSVSVAVDSRKHLNRSFDREEESQFSDEADMIGSNANDFSTQAVVSNITSAGGIASGLRINSDSFAHIYQLENCVSQKTINTQVKPDSVNETTSDSEELHVPQIHNCSICGLQHVPDQRSGTLSERSNSALQNLNHSLDSSARVSDLSASEVVQVVNNVPESSYGQISASSDSILSDIPEQHENDDLYTQPDSHYIADNNGSLCSDNTRSCVGDGKQFESSIGDKENGHFSLSKETDLTDVQQDEKFTAGETINSKKITVMCRKKFQTKNKSSQSYTNSRKKDKGLSKFSSKKQSRTGNYKKNKADTGCKTAINVPKSNQTRKTKLYCSVASEVQELACSFCSSSFSSKKKLESHKKCCLSTNEMNLRQTTTKVTNILKDNKRQAKDTSAVYIQYTDKATGDKHQLKLSHALKLGRKGEGHLKCPLCGKKNLRSLTMLKCHLLSSHGNIYDFEYQHDKNFTQKQSLITHKNNHIIQSYQCKNCMQKCASGTEMEQCECIGRLGSTFECNICGRVLRTKESLRRHKSTVHGTETPYKCDQCGMQFKHKDPFSRHQKLHEHPRHSCEVCGKSFHDLYYFKLHLQFHTNEKPWICEVCGKAFRQKKLMMAHLNKHKGERPYKCKVCGKGFRSHDNVRAHESLHNPNSLHICDICGKTFRQRGRLNYHRKCHFDNKYWKCKYCDTSSGYKSLITYKNHLIKHHAEKQHEIENETTLKFHKCELCLRLFVRVSDLQRHVLIHKGLKPYQCKLCDKAFNDKCNLRAHERTHYDQKMLTCPLCCKTFSQKRYLEKHMSSHKDGNNDNESLILNDQSITLSDPCPGQKIITCSTHYQASEIDNSVVAMEVAMINDNPVAMETEESKVIQSQVLETTSQLSEDQIQENDCMIQSDLVYNPQVYVSGVQNISGVLQSTTGQNFYQ